MKQQITITHKIDGLFDGCTEDELAGIDQAASAEKYGEMVADKLIATLRDENTNVKVSWTVEPTMRAFDITVADTDGNLIETPLEVTDTCDEISAQVFESWSWLVNA
jgi:hypothetical protein